MPDADTHAMFEETITALVLHEFRLRSAADRRTAADTVAYWTDSDDAQIPLLFAIDDPRGLALVVARRSGDDPETGRGLLSELVALGSEAPPRHFTPRLVIGIPNSSSYFRLAITESGINDPEPTADPAARTDGRPDPFGGQLRLLWVGLPLDTPAGLLLLAGQQLDGSVSGTGQGTTPWPLPLSTEPEVRIYAGIRGSPRVARTGHHVGVPTPI